MKKKILLIILLLSVAVSFTACNQNRTTNSTATSTTITTVTTTDLFGLEDETIYKYTYSQLGENIMPIGAWADPPPPNFAGVYDNPDLVTDAQYALISASGINVMYGLYNNASLNFDYVIKSLQYAENHDVVYIVRDSQVVGLFEEEDYEYLTDALDRYKDYEAFGGVMVMDEPGVQSFNNLGLLHQSFKTYLPNDAFYINLLPTYATNNQLINGAAGGNISDDTFTYEEYLQRYVTQVDPKFISYDFYPLVGMEYGDLRDGYFEQMSMVRNIAYQNDIPFWVFIQSCTFSSGHLRVPNQAEVMWQVSTSLAYGAKGIQYFTYYTPMEGSGSFEGGMVDSSGNINPMYYIVQEANQHIALVDEILMNSSHKGVIVHGDSPSEVPQEDQLEQFSILVDIIGDDALIGCFNYQGRPAYYVVNNSFDLQDAIVSLELDETYNYSVYQGPTMNEGNGNNIELTIPTGEGVLIVINE
ncbi:beta-galactosidase [Candidatus Izemoplasma sp. B36]|uniref:beta-galactosidase n=1 Tax=Candidatus Izemoplasma sp. B36 TaxID=3242468 RepID=UPI003559130D